MVWPFGKTKATIRKEREVRLDGLIADSQRALIEAATSTADAAHHVTVRLKQSLEDSRRTFDATLRILSEALIVCDEHGHIEAFNPAAEQMFGCSARDVPDKTMIGLFVLDEDAIFSVAKLCDAVEASVSEPVALGSRLLGRRVSGERFQIEATVARLDRKSGPDAVLILIREISDRIHWSYEADLQAQRYRALFDIAIDAIIIVQASKVVAANRSAGRLFRSDPTALVNTSVRSFLELPDIVPPALDGEYPFIDGIRSDGTNLKLIFSSAQITWNDEPATLITAKDVSEMKRVVTNTDNRIPVGADMIVCFDGDFRINFANEVFCAHYARKRVDLVGSDIRLVMSDADRDSFLLGLRNLTLEHPSQRTQLHTLDAEGHDRLLDWIDHASFDRSGKLIEYQRTGRDITTVLQEIMAS